MGIRFTFATANQIIFGENSSQQIPDKIKAFGNRICLITGKSLERSRWFVDAFISEGLEVQVLSISGEPTIQSVLNTVNQARAFNTEVTVGIGGGSVLDTGKVVAALMTNSGNLMDYLEVIGNGQPIQKKPIPYIAVPTTAGTGTEVTRNAVIGSHEHGVKVSMRHVSMLPMMAVVDPILTHSLPPDITASTGLDALTQLIEPFLSKAHNPLVDTICREGLHHAAGSLKQVFMHGSDAQARESMAIASLFGGLALTNAKLGAVHGIAGPMGGMFPAPHGIICARLLPHVMRMNFEALKSRNPESELIARFHELGKILTGNKKATAVHALNWIEEICVFFMVSPLSKFEVTESAFPELIEKSKKASSMRGNPIELNDDELFQILQKATYG